MRTITIEARELNLKAKSFEALAYTGGTLRLRNFEAPVVVDLARLSQRKSLIVNLDHDAERRVGHVTDVDNNGRELRLRGVLSAATPYRDEVLESYQSGFSWSASIEAEVDDWFEVARGASKYVNGRTFNGPVIVTKSTLAGFAFVSHGADTNTSISIAASRPYLPSYDAPQIFSPRSINKITNWISR